MAEDLTDVELLAQIVENLVDNPLSVVVVRTVDDNGVLLTLHVHKEDMGKVVGKAGVTAQAIRTILRGKGRKQNANVSIKIAEPEFV